MNRRNSSFGIGAKIRLPMLSILILCFYYINQSSASSTPTKPTTTKEGNPSNKGDGMERQFNVYCVSKDKTITQVSYSEFIKMDPVSCEEIIVQQEQDPFIHIKIEKTPPKKVPKEPEPLTFFEQAEELFIQVLKFILIVFKVLIGVMKKLDEYKFGISLFNVYEIISFYFFSKKYLIPFGKWIFKKTIFWSDEDEDFEEDERYELAGYQRRPAVAG